MRLALLLGLCALWAGARPAHADGPAVGRRHPALRLPTLDGSRTVDLRDLRGRRVLLVHLASWSAECRRQLPLWQEKTRALRTSGRLTVLGVAEEQHAHRCLLYARWQGLDWPILWDPFDVAGTTVVPRFTLIDEHGVVRSLRADPDTLESDFLARAFPAPEDEDPAPPRAARGALPEALSGRGGAQARAYYEALSDLLWNQGDADAAMRTLQRYAAAHPRDAAAQFRLGVAYRMRHDSGERHDGDFQAALDQWQKALALEPEQTVYRRRLQQYGPRLDKPYPFYAWVDEARTALQSRGESPPALEAPLTDAEVTDTGRMVPAGPQREPDPARDVEAPAGLLHLDAAVAWNTPDRRAPTDAARVHLVLRPSGNRVLLWDPDARPVTVWLELPAGWTSERRLFACPLRGTDRAEAQVALDFELGFPEGRSVPGVVRGYVLYRACLDGSDTCGTLRHDFEVRVPARR